MAVVSVLVLVLHDEVFFFPQCSSLGRDQGNGHSDSDTVAVTIAAVTIAVPP